MTATKNHPNIGLSVGLLHLVTAILIVSFIVPATAYDYSYTLSELGSSEREYYFDRGISGYSGGGGITTLISFSNVENFHNLDKVIQVIPNNGFLIARYTTHDLLGGGSSDFLLVDDVGVTFATGKLSWSANYKQTATIQEWILVWEFDTWNTAAQMSGAKSLKIKLLETHPFLVTSAGYLEAPGGASGSIKDIVFVQEYPDMLPFVFRLGHGAYFSGGYAKYIFKSTWENIVNIDSIDDGYMIGIVKNGHGSQVILNNDYGANFYYASTGNDLNIPVYGHAVQIAIQSPSRWYNTTYPASDPINPIETSVRTGTVTMTDNNGTTITGFNVTAINAYTGENYTVSTDTDVAVISLPMDRIIEIRNPQTGEYEEAPIGYYRFYGQASGYKMLNEEGIQVAVMPEKYTSYELCIILVTPESGPLTGKHQFQIRSRSDNTVLQTGTISAKSATTGEWYNTTVSGGIATLILPYDTSNSQSQYAGNYYVYATSPGYEDSDYGTQIVVMPQTVSEIRSILLTPIGGIPPAGNVTLRIQAFSETGPGIPNAEIFIAGVIGEGASVWDTYTASSTGYLSVSVPGNSTYDIVASGDGYYDSARRIEVFTDDPPLIEIKLYLSGAPTLEPTTQPTGWPTDRPTTQPTGGIPDEDDDSEGFLMQAVRGIGLAFGVGFATAKLIFGMLLALSIGYATAKQLRGGAAEFGLGLLGGTLLGVLIGLLPVWIIVVLLLVVGLYIGNRYVGGGNNG